MEKNQVIAFVFTALLFGGIIYWFVGAPQLSSFDFFENLFKKEEKHTSASKKPIASAKSGQVIDKYKGVNVFYNGRARNVFGRNVTKDGYNLGLKYQCVEFAKRFYYEAYNHKMPDSYGHAKDFFDPSIGHGKLNPKRNMVQFSNRQYTKPKVDDLCIIGPSPGNQFGHLFIITKVTNTSVEFIQQNPGVGNPSRGTYQLQNEDGTWNLKVPYLLGWLRMT